MVAKAAALPAAEGTAAVARARAGMEAEAAEAAAAEAVAVARRATSHRQRADCGQCRIQLQNK